MNNQNPTIKISEIPRIEIDLRNITKETVFELVRDIKDPEHPYTLEQLGVVKIEEIFLEEYLEDPSIICTLGYPIKYIEIVFTPTVPHCSLVGVIGLTIKYALQKLIKNHWIKVLVKEGSHSNDSMYNKQLSDYERVLAAFENESLMSVIFECLPERVLNMINEISRE